MFSAILANFHATNWFIKNKILPLCKSQVSLMRNTS